MNGLSAAVQLRGRRGRFVLALALLLSSRAAAEVGEPSPSALVAARELFREGTNDVDAGRFDAALAKFKRVAAVKETAAVRFNIARCEESLGKLGTALADFELAIREASADAKGGEVAKMAQERVAEIRPRVPRLTIAGPPNAPGDLALHIDGERQPNATLGVPLPVDPGRHTVEASTSSASFKKEVALREGQAMAVQIELSAPPGAGRGVDEPAGPHGEHDDASPNRTPGFIVLGGAGALGITSIVFLLLHNQSATDLDKQRAIECTLPNGRCPASARATLDPLQSSARTYEGLAIGFAAATAVALGVGAYLVLAPPAAGGSAGGKAKSTMIVPTPGGAAVVGRF